VVIDTGLNPGPAGPVGDVDAATAAGHAALITPVPGGIGTITLAVLLERTVAAARKVEELHAPRS
jgi:methylenetetrahydrofolate dehydrogenase (NADP+)/methenyltetrahydrofolate cyclohydrolase